MSLQRRLAVLAAAAVAIAVAAASVGLYLSVRGALRDEVDQSLRSRLAVLRVEPVTRNPPDAPPVSGQSTLGDPLSADQQFGGTVVFVQRIGAFPANDDSSGGSVELPVTRRDRDVAAGRAPDFFRDTQVGGRHLRVLTGHQGVGVALQLARPLSEVDSTLNRLLYILLGFNGAGVVLGALFGWLVARGALSPIRRLGLATRRVRSARDLAARVDVQGRDELAELAQDFNGMLEALEESIRSREQLVADASHELRTPVTSLRTYLEFLAREKALSQEEREQVLREALGQVGELSAVVSDLVELARGAEHDVVREPVRLDLVVEEAIERVARRAEPVQLEVRLEPTVVSAAPDLVLRAVKNLLDNAIKWSPPGRPIEVDVAGGVVTVRDHGPGFSEDDLPHLFDRFYRSREARALPGSGLGLAIVKQVAELHGGGAAAANAAGGGAELTLDLSTALVPDRASPEPEPALSA